MRAATTSPDAQLMGVARQLGTSGSRSRKPSTRGWVRYVSLQAERKLELGRLDEACADWHRVLDDYPYVKSGRCDDRFATMMSSLRPHLRNANVRTLHERALPMAPAKTTRA